MLQGAQGHAPWRTLLIALLGCTRLGGARVLGMRALLRCTRLEGALFSAHSSSHTPKCASLLAALLGALLRTLAFDTLVLTNCSIF